MQAALSVAEVLALKVAAPPPEGRPLILVQVHRFRVGGFDCWVAPFASSPPILKSVSTAVLSLSAPSNLSFRSKGKFAEPASVEL